MAKRSSSKSPRLARKMLKAAFSGPPPGMTVDRRTGEFVPDPDAENEAQTKKRFLAGHPFRIFILVVLICAVAIGGMFAALQLTKPPWARGGQLADRWEGTISFGPGDERTFVLFLEGSTGLRGGSDPANASGKAKVCGPAGKIEYDVIGDVANDEGSRFSVELGKFFEGGGLPAGRHVGAVNGTWDGGDRLAVQTFLYTRDANANRTDQSAPIALEMQRISENAYNAAC